MASSFPEVQSIAEFLELLRTEQGDSYETLSKKIRVSASTLHRLEHGGKADDPTLDKIADYAGVTREWLYALAKGTAVRPKYSRTVSLLAALLEEAPPDIAEIMLIQARALIQDRKKQSNKIDQPGNNLISG